MRSSLCGLFALLLFAGCSDSRNGSPPTAPRVQVARIALEPDSAALRVGDSIRFTATAYDARGQLLAGQKFTWSTSDSVATVDATGMVRALRDGRTAVRASVGSVQGQSVVRSEAWTRYVLTSANFDPLPSRVASAEWCPAPSWDMGPVVVTEGYLDFQGNTVQIYHQARQTCGSQTYVSGGGYARMPYTKEGSTITVMTPPEMDPKPMSNIIVLGDSMVMRWRYSETLSYRLNFHKR